MPIELNDRIKNLVPYTPISGEYKIRLDANESYFNYEPEQIQKLQEKLPEILFNRYPDPYAKKLISAFSKWQGIDESCAVAGNGSDELISLILSTFLCENDKIIVFEPDFSMYAFYSYLCGLNTIKLKKNHDFSIDFELLSSEIQKSGAKLVIFSNPCNPTGRAEPRKEILKIVDLYDGCLFVVDEAYMDFSNQSIIKEAAQKENLIVLKTMSKLLSSAALRVGFAVANKSLCDTIKAVKSPYNLNGISQAFAEILLSDIDFIQKRAEIIIKNREKLYAELCKLKNVLNFPFIPYKSDANFVFIKTAAANAIFEYLLGKSICVRKFEGYLRITVGSKEENKALISALKEIQTVR